MPMTRNDGLTPLMAIPESPIVVLTTSLNSTAFISSLMWAL